MSAARKPTSRKTGASKSTAKRGSRKNPAGSASKATAKKASARRSAASKASSKKAAAKKATRAKRSTTKRQKAPKKTTARRKSTARRPSGLDAKAVAKIRARLEEERRALEAEMAELEEESFRGTQSEITGEVGIDEDFADAGSATFDREQALSIANNIRDLIDQVDRALARIDEGTYGSCERCGRPIEAARLRALPRTLLCTDCKRREERAR
jgi:RNA polymerase-binding protein DksA